MLKQFGPEIWTADGPEVIAALGFHYPTRMAVIRLPAWGLFVWSPIALTKDVGAALDALGDVRHIVAPNSLHHVFLADWQQAYPGAQVHAAPGLREKRKDVRFDGDLGDQPDAGWSHSIDQVVMRGNRITTEVVFFHRQSRTVLFTDLIQHFPRGRFTGWRGIVARLDLMTGAEPAVPRKFRFAFADRHAALIAARHILAWPTQKVLMAHGTPVSEDGQAFLARAFQWLTGRERQ